MEQMEQMEQMQKTREGEEEWDPTKPLEEEEEEGDYEGGDDAPGEEDADSSSPFTSPRSIVEDESLPIGKQFAPGGSLHDYFFEAAPRWTVGNALNRILTKVRNNPDAMMTIQKFVKDSCKGNLKKYFNDIRASMPQTGVVMAEIAYLSFLQLSQGDNPYIILHTPKRKPRTRAAAVSPEGYAYKDYLVQVTKAGFDLMQAKMTTLTDSDVQNYSLGQEGSVDGDTGQPPLKRRRGNSKPTPRRSTSVQMPFSLATAQPGFVPRITEQEQEAANNMLLFVKASTDGFLATIHHLRSENDQLRKENLALKIVSETLMDDVRSVKLQLASHGIIPVTEVEPLYNHPELGAHKQAEAAAHQILPGPEHMQQ